MNETANSPRIHIFCILRVALGSGPKLKLVLKTRSTFRVGFRVKQLIFKGENTEHDLPCIWLSYALTTTSLFVTQVTPRYPSVLVML